MTAKGGRANFIDYGKGMIVLIVILSHFNPCYYDVGSFNMIFFFFASGYVQRKGRHTLAESTKLRFKGILVPFWKAMLILGLMEIPRAYYFGYGDFRIFLLPILYAIYGSGHLPYLGEFSDYVNSLKPFHPDGTEGLTDVIVPMTCALWFLPALFCASMMFYIYVNKIRKGLWTDIIAIAILCVLTFGESACTWQLPYCLGRAFWGCTGMIAGYAAKEFDIFETGKKRIPIFLISAVIAVSFAIAGFTTCSMPNASYYGPYGLLSVSLTVIGGVASSIFFCYLLRGLEKLLKGHDGVLCTIGRNTMPLYLWHMPIINLLSIALLLATQTPPHFSLMYVALLPDEWAIWKWIFMAMTATIILLTCKATRRLH